MTFMSQWGTLDQLNVLEETSAWQPVPRYIQPRLGETICEFLGLTERGHVVCGLRLKTYTVWFLLLNSCTNDFSWKTKQVAHKWFLFLSLEHWQKQWEMQPPAAVGYLKNTWQILLSMLRETAELIPCRVDWSWTHVGLGAESRPGVEAALLSVWSLMWIQLFLCFDRRTWEWRRSLPSWPSAAAGSGVCAVAGGENAGCLAIYQEKLPEPLRLEEGEGRE